MIDTKDIRLGNLVLDKHEKPRRVSEIGKTGIKVEGGPGTYRQYAGEFSPIPLTDEWLLCLGFNERARETEYANFFTDNQFGVHHKIIGDEYFNSGFYHGEYYEITYVHQLQNLYYALTSKELKVNMELL